VVLNSIENGKIFHICMILLNILTLISFDDSIIPAILSDLNLLIKFYKNDTFSAELIF
jgi:hypothetical protein